MTSLDKLVRDLTCLGYIIAPQDKVRAMISEWGVGMLEAINVDDVRAAEDDVVGDAHNYANVAWRTLIAAKIKELKT